MPKLQTGSWRKDRKRGNRGIVPTVMLGHGHQQIYVQGGHFFSAGGKPVSSPPEWVMAAVAAMPKVQLDRLGFEMKFGKPKPKSAPKQPEPAPEPELPDPDEDAEE